MVFDLIYLAFLGINLIWPYHPIPGWNSIAKLKNWGRCYLICMININIFQAVIILYSKMGAATPDLFHAIAPIQERYIFFGSTRVIFAIFTLDFFGYVFHLSMHKFSILRRVHAVHHIEQDISVFTANRAHPIEVSILVILTFISFNFFACSHTEMEIAFIVTGFFTVFTHANWRLPIKWERSLGVLFETSGHHHWHHVKELQNGRECNYGGIFSIWDRVFKTYRAPEISRHFVYGIEGLCSEQTNLLDMLLLRFRRTEKIDSHASQKQKVLNA